MQYRTVKHISIIHVSAICDRMKQKQSKTEFLRIVESKIANGRREKKLKEKKETPSNRTYVTQKVSAMCCIRALKVHTCNYIYYIEFGAVDIDFSSVL